MVVAFAGVLLQWFGLAFVAWGILGRRKDFGRQWFRRLWGAWKEPINATLNIQLGSVEASGRIGGVTVSHGPTTIEGRLRVLEGRVDGFEQELKACAAAAKSDVEEIRKHLARESTERAAAITTVRAQFKKFAVNEIHLEAIGLFWIFVSALFSGIPGEVAKWF